MKYLRRIIWFAAARLLAACLILGLVITAFYYAMNLSNIQIILKDGMANRAKFIMGITDDASDLGRYFQQAYLDSDQELNLALQGNSQYADYNVRGIDHRLEMGFLWVWPWDNSVRVTITESIPRIDGRVKSLKADSAVAALGERGLYPPDWPGGSYKALLVKENGQWKIKSLTVVQSQ